MGGREGGREKGVGSYPGMISSGYLLQLKPRAGLGQANEGLELSCGDGSPLGGLVLSPKLQVELSQHLTCIG